ncbi:beta-ketoacyl synthase N-terminal-like domain-containing protein [Panacagrimonas sp.]|uniref:beta-ketoacyl synthase N-terminal-like domain-containing protein n=1 Tax=Panacagrimonas sp. TaxID=2480088 RepID=UPI003B51AB7E
MTAPLDIAIIGLAGVYPGAADAGAFWQNICDKVDAITDADPEWVGPYFEADTKADDRIYTVKGGFLRELAHVDPLEVGVMPNIAAGADPDHLISLKMARDAMRDAGYLDRKFDSSRAGIVIGRGTYGNRGFASMLSRGFFLDQMMEVIHHLRPDFSAQDIRALHTDFKKQLPPYGGDMVGVLTPNAIAGLIANRLDLMGPSFIVDAACASTLIALDAATRELSTGRCDLMIAGGTHVQTPAMLFIQFSQIGALSRDRLRPFQKGAEGTLLGEGCGMLVLKRLADAERDGDRVYAVIKGIGTASDGKAKGLLAPRLEGEVLAVRRAYESSGIDPLTVDLIEAHGTGTSVGDATEIQSLTQVYGARGVGPHIAVSAVKSMIGHCLPGTAAASMIKTALALHHKILPPMLCDEPDPALNLERTPFYINNQTRPWIHGGATPRRAGVNAFGFGGINAHVILEEYSGPRRELVPSSQLLPPRASEMLLLSAANHAQLVSLVRSVLAHLRSAHPPGLAELAQSAARRAVGEHRLALVAESAEELTRKLEAALEKLIAPDCRPFKLRGGAAYGRGAAPGKLCLLFPGEGSQYPGMLAELCLHFPQVRDWFDFIEDNARARGSRSRSELLFPAPTVLNTEQRAALEAALFDMDVGAESVYAASLGLQALIDDIGLLPDAMLGHSTGENTALTAGKVRRFVHREEVAEAVQSVNAFFRKLEAEGRIAHGSLLTVGGLTRDTRSQLMAQVQAAGCRMQLAMDNCPNQVVLFGPSDVAAQWRERLAADGAICQELPFGRAYHTPLFKPLADAFRAYFKTLDFGPGRVPLYSARACAPFPEEPDAIRELAAQQWENPVRFTETLERLYADGFRVFLEVGPSANLTAFVSDTLRGKADVLALATNSRRKDGLAHLQQTLAQLFVAGVRFDAARLYAHRRIDEFDLLADPRPAPKARPRNAIPMPEVRLPEAWKQRKPPPIVAAPAPATPAAASAHAAESAPSAAAVSEDPRAQALRAHFGLMQEFLDSQARVLEMAGVLPSSAAAGATLLAADADRFPLLGPIVDSSADMLVSERRYDLLTDLFIRDHCIGGAPSAREPELLAIPVIPFTFSMEICAEAAMRLLDRSDRVVVALEKCRGSRWLSLDDGQVQLRIVAERAGSDGEQDRIQCRLFLQDPGGPAGGMAVFEAQVLLAEAYPAPPAPMGWTSPDAQAPVFNADGRLYRRGMFHGPRLQGAVQVRRHGDAHIDMDLQTLPTQDYFAFTTAPRLQLDATLADVLGQTFYYWLQEREGALTNCFPYQVARLSLYAPPLPAGTRVSSRTQLGVAGPERLSGTIEALGPDGRVLMRAEGWDDRTFEVPQRFHRFRLEPAQGALGEPWMDGLLPPGLFARRVAPFENDLLSAGGGIWGRGLAHMVLGRAERQQFYALPATGPRRAQWLMGRVAAKEAVRDWVRYKHGQTLASADVEIVADTHGKPLARCAALGLSPMPAVSISHSQQWAAAVVAEPGLDLGLDYQRLDRLQDESRLIAAFDAEERRYIDAANDRPRVACALWCAREAAAKAAGLGLQGRPQDWRVVDARLDPRAVSFGSVRIRHGDRLYDVALQFEGREALSALCLSAASGMPVATG